MLIRFGRIAASVVAIVTGLFVLLDFFLEVPLINLMSLLVVRWAAIILAFALMLGLVNVARVHISRLRARQDGWIYSLILLLALLVTLVAGRSGPASAAGRHIFEVWLRPLESTLFALLIFLMVTAVFRAFRVRNFETFLFLLAAILVLLGQATLVYLLPDPLGQILVDIKDLILDAPAVAGARGILLGVALGTIATGLRVLMGVDRPYADRG
ncbi:MAG: hypothetical protein ACE5H9_06230 [Anaerolineae bacterium]